MRKTLFVGALLLAVFSCGSPDTPDPDPVLMTLDKLSFKADETLVVGDMPVDIQMGLGAHAYTCGVPYGNASKEALAAAGAHAVIEHFCELEEVIAKF